MIKEITLPLLQNSSALMVLSSNILLAISNLSYITDIKISNQGPIRYFHDRILQFKLWILFNLSDKEINIRSESFLISLILDSWRLNLSYSVSLIKWEFARCSLDKNYFNQLPIKIFFSFILRSGLGKKTILLFML